MMDLGVSFSPAARDKAQPQGSGQPTEGGSQTPIQDAIRTLSLRIPKFRGPGIAPQPLLGGPGMAGVMPGMAIPGGVGGVAPGGPGAPTGLFSILQQIFGQGAGSGAGVPLPNVIPVEQGQQPTTLTTVNPPTAPQPPSGLPEYTPPDFFPGQWPMRGGQ